MPTASGNAGVAQRELAAIQVDLIPDRPGQVLRQALQDRFERDGSGVAHLYDLSVGFSVSGEGIAIQPDSSVDPHPHDRQRQLDPGRTGSGRTKLSSGYAKAVDGFNLIDTQYFRR